jgi:hypothetical protein
MAIFKYTLPSGAQFTVNAPAGTTQEQADKIFYEQVAAGTLVGFESGQSLTSPESQLVKFGLSRQDRGTAGVEELAVLAVVNNLPRTDEVVDTTNVPLYNPVTQSAVANERQGLGSTTVGPLSPIDVQTLTAQLAAQVDQPYTEISQLKGVGKYGFNCLQLEQAGYIKPGTHERFLKSQPISENPDPSFPVPANADNFVAVMQSPGVWTGKDGVNNVNQVLASESLQSKIQQTLIAKGYSALVSAGTIIPPIGSGVNALVGQVFQGQGLIAAGVGNFQNIGTTAQAVAGQVKAQVGSLVQNASKLGAQATTLWNKGLSTNVSGALDSVGRMGKYAVNFAQGKLGSLVSGVQPAAAFAGTVNRSTVDAAFVRVLGSNKIPTPTFSPPAPGTQGLPFDLAQAQSVLSGARAQGTQIASRATTVFNPNA